MRRNSRSLGARILVLPFAIAVGAVCMPSEAAAAPSPKDKLKGKGGNFGIGGTIGDPMGVSAKLFLHPKHALQFDLGWAPLHHWGGNFAFSYLWHPATWASTQYFDFLGYLGLGIQLGLWNDGFGYLHHGHGGHGHHHTYVGFGMRLPVLGLAFHWKKVPLDSVLEGAYSPYFVEGTGGHGARPGFNHGDVSFKVRYYF